MHQLTGRLTALDPDAGAALRVITYFDELLNQHAGLESIVRGAAVLVGAPARLMTSSRAAALRVLPDGRRVDQSTPPEDTWFRDELPEHGVIMWLEREGEPGPVEAMVLERALQAARTVLERTRGRYVEPRRQDDDLVEMLLDPEVSAVERAHAIRALGFQPGQVVQVVATADARPRVVAQGVTSLPTPDAEQRTGIGVPVPVENAPVSARSARLALRLTAEGTPTHPGPRVLHASDLGATLLLARGFDQDPAWASDPDVLAIERAAGQIPWLMSTLWGLSTTTSLRAAAAILHLHHSTLQKRLARTERVLGWDVTTATGKLRLQVALTVRLLAAAGPQA